MFYITKRDKFIYLFVFAMDYFEKLDNLSNCTGREKREILQNAINDTKDNPDLFKKIIAKGIFFLFNCIALEVSETNAKDVLLSFIDSPKISIQNCNDIINLKVPHIALKAIDKLLTISKDDDNNLIYDALKQKEALCRFEKVNSSNNSERFDLYVRLSELSFKLENYKEFALWMKNAAVNRVKESDQKTKINETGQKSIITFRYLSGRLEEIKGDFVKATANFKQLLHLSLDVLLYIFLTFLEYCINYT